MKILIADDDPQIIRALKITLGAAGYDVITATTGTEALDQAAHQHPDVIMLDLGMPHLDGMQVIEAIRGWSQVPILVVSGRTGAADKVEALDAGADDYVTKPFAMDELRARIRALGRRVSTADDEAHASFGDVHVDFAAKMVTRTVAGVSERIRLTPTEWRLLELLTQSPGKLITRETILTQIWGPNHSKDNGYLRLYMAQLRKKLEPVPASPRYLVTVLGMGYQFVPSGTQDWLGTGSVGTGSVGTGSVGTGSKAWRDFFAAEANHPDCRRRLQAVTVTSVPTSDHE